jgi:hypothetical protein
MPASAAFIATNKALRLNNFMMVSPPVNHRPGKRLPC